MLASHSFFSCHTNPRAKIKLFCFPYGGGNGSTYSSWLQTLPEDVEVCAIDLPGRSHRFTEPPYTSMGDLIDDLMKVFPSIIDKPYMLMGHSLGSRMAFELMRKCQQENLRMPEYFIASGSAAPHIQDKQKGLYKLPDQQFIHELRKLNGTPEEVLDNKELMQLTMPNIRADFELSENYVYNGSTQFDCPLAVFYGDEDHEIPLSEIEAWQEHFSQKVQVFGISGDHFFIEKNQYSVLQKMRLIINEVVNEIKSNDV